MTLEIVTPEEFEVRLDIVNEQLRQELAETQKRVRRLDNSISVRRFSCRNLDRMLIESERDKAETMQVMNTAV